MCFYIFLTFLFDISIEIILFELFVHYTLEVVFIWLNVKRKASSGGLNNKKNMSFGFTDVRTILHDDSMKDSFYQDDES